MTPYTAIVRKHLTKSQLRDASDSLRVAIDHLVDIDDPDDAMQSIIADLLSVDSRVYDAYLDLVIPTRSTDEETA